MNRPKNERLNCLRHMPPLHHVTGEKYDIMNSEVMDWIVKQPEVRQWLYDKITDKSGGRKSEFVERFPEFSLFYRLFSPLDSEMICIFPYFYPCEESAREIREIFI